MVRSFPNPGERWERRDGKHALVLGWLETPFGPRTLQVESGGNVYTVDGDGRRRPGLDAARDLVRKL